MLDLQAINAALERTQEALKEMTKSVTSIALRVNALTTQLTLEAFENPQAGDIWRNGNFTRTILRSDDDFVYFTSQESDWTFKVDYNDWREFCDNATLLARG